MNKKKYAIWAMLLTITLGLTSCSDDNSESAAGLSIASFYPTIVMNGTEVEITGSGLAQTTDVVFPGGQLATAVRVIDDNRIIATAPAGVSETPDVLVVQTEGDQVESRQTIHKANPTLRYFNPSDVAKTFEDLQIEGNDFLLAESVIFGEGEDAVEVKALDFKRKSNSNVTITLPEKTPLGENIPVKMRFDNGETLDLGNLNVEEGEKPGGHWEEKTKVLYSGDPVVIGNWENSVEFAKGTFADANVGDIIRIYVKDPVAGEWADCQIQQDWSSIEGMDIPITADIVERGYFDVVLDEVTLPIFQDNIIRIRGSYYTVTKVERIYQEWISDITTPQETEVYSGDPVVIGNWENSVEFAKGTFADANVGDIIRIHVKDPVAGEWADCQIQQDWSSIEGMDIPITADIVERGYFDVVLDEVTLPIFQDNIIRIRGSYYTVTKVTLILNP